MVYILCKIKEIYNKNYKIFNYVFCIFFILLFLVLTLKNPNFYNFNKDEMHAWNIAVDLNFLEIVKLMKTEGHCLIWYMMLKPFTKYPDLFFPWILKWLNLIFLTGAISIFWFKAPINKLFKILITFSFPVIGAFAILGRCYGIGIFLLCLIAINYKNRFKRPVLYSILLFLTAHTSLIAAISIFGISIIYVIELIKERKIKNLIPLIILALIPVTLYLLWHNPIIPPYSVKLNLYWNFHYHMFNSHNYIPKSEILIAIYSLGIIISALYFRYKKLFFTGLILTFGLFIIFALKVYAMFDYHFHFMFIAYCFYYCIYSSQEDILINKTIRISFNIWFVILCIILNPAVKRHNYWYTYSDIMNMALNCIYETVPKENSIIYTNMYTIGRELPYLRDKYLLKTFNGDKFYTLDTYYNTYSDDKKYALYDEKKLRSIDKNIKNKYILVHNNFIDQQLLTEKFKKHSKQCAYLYLYKLRK